MKSEDDSSISPHYEITLRAIGQALEALGVESFELVLDGGGFVVYGGSDTDSFRRRSSPPKFRLFRPKAETKSRRGFFISGMRFRPADIKRLDVQGKNARSNTERSPNTNSLAHGLRMIGADIDNTGLNLLAIAGCKGSFTVWHKTHSGMERKEIFTGANLYDLWVHLYKKRRTELRRTGTTSS